MFSNVYFTSIKYRKKRWLSRYVFHYILDLQSIDNNIAEFVVDDRCTAIGIGSKATLGGGSMISHTADCAGMKLFTLYTLYYSI